MFEMSIKMIREGGPVLWVILGLSLLALGIFLNKVFQLHREEINVRELMRGLTNVLERDGYVEALTLCDNTPGPAARLLGAAILAYQRGDEDIRQAIDDAALDELPKLERHVGLLGTLGFIFPLLGFFGTVCGMLQVFDKIRSGVSFTAAAIMDGGAVTSLVTTAAALAVAIPCYLAYNYLVSRVDTITLDMEKAALEIVSFFEHRAATRKAAAK